MPRKKEPVSLTEASSRSVASLLLRGCQTLDRRWEEPAQPPQLGSPTRPSLGSPNPFLSPPREEVPSLLPAEQRPLLSWLSHLPDPVVETVVAHLLEQVETQLMEDKDKKIIMTLINIEHMKVNDFFFGIHSLLSMVRGFQLSSLQFSRRLWFCLWEYSEITGSRRLGDAICSSLPGLSSLTSLSLSHVATDRVLYVVSRHLPTLLNLDLSSSRVTDRGLRFITGSHQITSFHRPGSVVSASVVRNLSSLLDSGRWGEIIPETSPDVSIPSNKEGISTGGCSGLALLNLQSCDGVSEAGVKHVLENLPKLKRLIYHQVSSVLEILIKWGSGMTEEQRTSRELGLTEVEHGFPYGLSPLSTHLEQLVCLCPHLTTLTLVTDDRVMEMLSLFPKITRLTVELEDCLGEGFLSLLEQKGGQLEELTLSCSSDPEASLPLEVAGGQQGQLFNLATLAVGSLVPKIRKLSVTGCGLVAASAMEKIELLDKIGSCHWLARQTWFSQLERFMLMSYEDSLPSMTINSGLLRSVLISASNLVVLNLEGNFGSFLTDPYMDVILSKNCLSRLTTLDISFNDQGGIEGRVPLTVRTVRQLLRVCTDLRELRVSDWKIDNVEFASIQDMVQANNWDLFLTRKLITT